VEKRSHLGMAGHYAAMSEFLYRGYNVAVPSVDVGDDVYVVEDNEGTMWRLQVKTADGASDERRAQDGSLTSMGCSYALSRRQLRTEKANELFFMFMVRWEGRWRFVLIARDALSEIRARFEAADRSGKSGRKPVPDEEAKNDGMTLRIEWRAADAEGWSTSLAPYLDRWPEEFPENPAGPGAA
jgi:hypothetical protein